MIRDVFCVILGGGRGTRLYPLTKTRAKPAVPLGGKYRLIDVPISNCINSGIEKIYVLTQFNSASLHRHISTTYRFDAFSRGSVMILAAEQTINANDWYQGTADAVRKHIRRIAGRPEDHVLILSGDQLYRMDFRKIIDQHKERKAEVTLAVLPVPEEDATSLGLMHVDRDARVIAFREKPKERSELDEIAVDEKSCLAHGLEVGPRKYLASMGIYLFRKEVLIKMLEDDARPDFGKHIIPSAIGQRDVYAHFFEGYWEDIGDIRRFYEANLDFGSVIPQFNFFNTRSPIYTHPRFLPATKVHSCELTESVLADGCILDQVTARNSLVGVRSLVRRGTVMDGCVMMGADFFQDAPIASVREVSDDIPLGIGENCRLQRTIVDKNACIGDEVVIANEKGLDHMDGENYSIREGIVVVHKDAVIPSGTVI